MDCFSLNQPNPTGASNALIFTASYPQILRRRPKSKGAHRDYTKIKKILTHELDCAATIVTSGKDGPHVVNTWNSYIQIVDDETLRIPAGGLKHTEANLKANPAITLSISNRVLPGFNYPGTGVIVKGVAQIIYDTEDVENLKKNTLGYAQC